MMQPVEKIYYTNKFIIIRHFQITMKTGELIIISGSTFTFLFKVNFCNFYTGFNVIFFKICILCIENSKVAQFVNPNIIFLIILSVSDKI